MVMSALLNVNAMGTNASMPAVSLSHTTYFLLIVYKKHQKILSNFDARRRPRGDRWRRRQSPSWFGGKRKIEISEDVVGLGRYGKTLTIVGQRV